MEFRTKVKFFPPAKPIEWDSNTLLLGSCFSDEIGNKMILNKFHCIVNPFGTLYSPSSVFQILQILLNNESDIQQYSFENDGIFSNWLFSTTFSSPDQERCTNKIKKVYDVVSKSLDSLDCLFLTWGTPYFYTLKNTDFVVSNCLKQSKDLFDVHIASVGELVAKGIDVFKELFERRRNLHIVQTVSPYRYLNYGLHENNLCKSTLLLFSDALCKEFPQNVSYFPSFEILQDELRDYRFYASDMLHPSQQAVEYVWDLLKDNWMSSATQQFIEEWTNIRKSLEHRFLGVNVTAQLTFLEKLLESMVLLGKKYANLAVENEIQTVQEQIKQLKIK